MRADEQRLPCYLETHGEKSARLYERHGFETVRLSRCRAIVPFGPCSAPRKCVD